MKRLFISTAIALIFAAPQANALDLFKKDSDWQSQRFRNLDTNHDGKISQEEYLHDNVEQFKNMDQDKSGALSPDEVDFSPGTPEASKPMLRKQMREDEERQAASLAKMKEEQEKAQKEAIEASKKAAESVAKTKPPAVEAAPKVAPKAAAAPTPAAAKPAATPTTTSAPAAAKTPAAATDNDDAN